jgi:hypothetical protein
LFLLTFFQYRCLIFDLPSVCQGILFVYGIDQCHFIHMLTRYLPVKPWWKK